MGFNANDVFPYNEIKKVVVDGQDMVRIPRFYIKNRVVQGGPYDGRPVYSISKTPAKGYHVYPAFMNHGVISDAVDLSCYEASADPNDKSKPASLVTTSFWEGVNRKTAIDLCNKRNTDPKNPEKSGWHCWDIYCTGLIEHLMLYEFGTTRFAFQEDGTPDYIYHGIHQPEGNAQHPMWIPGLGNVGDQMYVYDMNGGEILVNTELKCPGNGWPTKFSMMKGLNFDLGDVFIAETVSQVETEGICNDHQQLQREWVEAGFTTGFRGSGTKAPENAHGMFSFYATDPNAGARFRLAHYHVEPKEAKSETKELK